MAPRTVQIVGTWQLRADPDLPFRRTNATIPFAGESTDFDVDARIDAVEHFYRERGLPRAFSSGRPPNRPIWMTGWPVAAMWSTPPLTSSPS